MTVGPWTFYDSTRRFIGDGTLDLDDDTFMMNLFTHLSNAGDVTTPTVFADLTNQVANDNGYLSSGVALSGVTWVPAPIPGQMRFNAASITWAASGGDIVDVMYAVISKANATASARKLLCFSQLADAQFNIPSGYSLRVKPDATNGIFIFA